MISSRAALLGVLMVACGGSAAAPPRPRARYIQCPSHSLGADLELAPGGAHYVGHGRDNYQDTRWPVCRVSGAEIRCDGVWSHDQQPSQLVVTAAPDGTLHGRLLGPHAAQHDMICFARDTPLSNDCVFNPGTPSCHEAPP
ncbi:MAG: hypothetical protein KF819_18260 [Labilithrix sp.]|nr:hypothetical protein [Labilithrix sp.]